jgi:hypothetical protein
VTVALGAGLGENMTLLPPIPPSQPSGSFGFDAGDYRRECGDPGRWDAGRVYRALVGAAQVCAGILLTLMGISAGKVQSEYGTKTPSLLKDAPPLLLVATGILLGLAGVAQLVHAFRRGQDD